MRETCRGAGVLFYDKDKRRVLVYRRDNTPTIHFPDQIDILPRPPRCGTIRLSAERRSLAASRQFTVAPGNAPLWPFYGVDCVNTEKRY